MVTETKIIRPLLENIFTSPGHRNRRKPGSACLTSRRLRHPLPPRRPHPREAGFGLFPRPAAAAPAPAPPPAPASTSAPTTAPAAAPAAGAQTPQPVPQPEPAPAVIPVVPPVPAVAAAAVDQATA